MSAQRFPKEHVQKQLAKQGQQFQAYLIECLRLTLEAYGVCLHIVKKNGEECAICGKYVDPSN